MIDIREPKNPKFVGCFADTEPGAPGTGYSHDAQCVIYKGPDKRYKGREICIGSNETAISLAGRHRQGEPEGHLARGVSERRLHAPGLVRPRTSKLLLRGRRAGREPAASSRRRARSSGIFIGPREPEARQGTHGRSKPRPITTCTSRATCCIRRTTAPACACSASRTRVNPKEIAYFDTAPFHPNTAGFNGAWSVYPFFKSGTIIVSSIEQGLFIVKTADR